MRAVNRKTAKNGRSLGAYGKTGGFCRQRPDTFAAIQNPWRPCLDKRSHPAMLYPQRDSTVQPLPGRRSRSDLMIAGKMKGGQRPPLGSTQKLCSLSLCRVYLSVCTSNGHRPFYPSFYPCGTSSCPYRARLRPRWTGRIRWTRFAR